MAHSKPASSSSLIVSPSTPGLRSSHTSNFRPHSFGSKSHSSRTPNSISSQTPDSHSPHTPNSNSPQTPDTHSTHPPGKPPTRISDTHSNHPPGKPTTHISDTHSTHPPGRHPTHISDKHSTHPPDQHPHPETHIRKVQFKKNDGRKFKLPECSEKRFDYFIIGEELQKIAGVISSNVKNGVPLPHKIATRVEKALKLLKQNEQHFLDRCWGTEYLHLSQILKLLPSAFHGQAKTKELKEHLQSLNHSLSVKANKISLSKRVWMHKYDAYVAKHHLHVKRASRL